MIAMMTLLTISCPNSSICELYNRLIALKLVGELPEGVVLYTELFKNVRRVVALEDVPI